MKEEFLNKAKENLKIAQMSFDAECYNACANRAYYAAFQAAISALAGEGVQKGKNDHGWVQSEFNLRLIKRKKVYPSEFRGYLPNMQIIRNIADYSQENIAKRLAYEQLSQAVKMLHAIEMESER